MADSIYDLSFTSNTGEEVSLKQYEGKPLLIVNTASKCGFTPQYKGLQEIYEELGSDLVVLGFPCDQFAHQEPGDDAQIKDFCEVNYGVTFPLSTKIDVNGSKTHPIFAYVKEKAGGLLGSSIKWNFTKFLVAPDGTTVKRYAPKTDPEMVKIDAEELLERSSGAWGPI
jgi:glutathione peroxidase